MRHAWLALLFAGPLLAAAVEYDLRPGQGSRFALWVEKTGLLRGKKHLFVFERYMGKLVYDDAAPEQSKVELAIVASSAALLDDWVSEKDRKKILKVALEDMMDAAHHPQLRFVSRTIKPAGEGSFAIEGDLTIRGMSKPVVVHAKLEQPAPGAVGKVTGSAIVKIRDYGLKPPSAVLGAIGTKNEMTLEFALTPEPAGSQARPTR